MPHGLQLTCFSITKLLNSMGANPKPVIVGPNIEKTGISAANPKCNGAESLLIILLHLLKKYFVCLNVIDPAKEWIPGNLFAIKLQRCTSDAPPSKTVIRFKWSNL